MSGNLPANAGASGMDKPPVTGHPDMVMKLELIGPHPFAVDPQGRQLTRIGTLFPAHRVLYTAVPGIHAWQRISFIDELNARRVAEGRPVLTGEEEETVVENSVDLIFESDHILIRPDAARMELTL